MTQPLGDQDLAAMVGLTGGERITPEQAAWWLHRPSPTASLREQISWAIAGVDLVEGADEARETLPADYDGPNARADAVLSKVVSPLLKAKEGWIAELSRDLRDTHQRLIAERHLTAAYSARRGFFREFGGPRPEIVVLCGSTRFKEAWYEEGRRLTHLGAIVLSVGDLDASSAARDVNVPIDPDLKCRLDELHKRKIDLADRVLVLNVGGYIGESTRSEIEYAEKLGRPIEYLESGGEC